VIAGGDAALLGIGADDSLYVAVGQQLRRIAPGGATEVLLDGAVWPPLNGADTDPVDLAIAPDGTLFVAAQARLLRVDPDGSVHELLTATDDGLGFVALGSEGRVFAPTSSGFHVLAPGSAPAFVTFPIPDDSSRNFQRDPDGGFWSFGKTIAQVDADGAIDLHFGYEKIPDGLGGTTYAVYSATVDELGNVYYSAAGGVMRLTPDGAVERVLHTETPLVGSDIVRGFLPNDLHVAEGALYVADDQEDYWYFGPCPPDFEWECMNFVTHPPRILRVAVPGETACTNRQDDDGDGLADFPADKGCLSPDDEGERSFAHPCDNGVDDDQDGAIDFPADPGCVSLTAPQERTECDDGVDNDGDGAADWDGAGAGAADPECGGDPRRVIEHPW
jgi:hypothetical protein